MVLLRLCVSIIIASFLFLPSLYAADPAKVLIAHGAIRNNVEPLWIAKEQGIFRKYGVEAELVFIIAGRAMQAMLAGQVPVGLVGGTHVVNANTGGGDFTMVLGLENQLDYWFLAKPTIKGGEDLKGKKVGIGTPVLVSAIFASHFRGGKKWKEKTGPFGLTDSPWRVKPSPPLKCFVLVSGLSVKSEHRLRIPEARKLNSGMFRIGEKDRPCQDN